MARRRKMTPERREFINGLLEHYQPTDAQDVQEMLKDLLGDTLQGMLEAEMDRMIITKNPDSDVCGNLCKTLKLFGISGSLRILVSKSHTCTDCSVQISSHDFVKININFQCPHLLSLIHI